jgi:hypothetical protein
MALFPMALLAYRLSTIPFTALITISSTWNGSSRKKSSVSSWISADFPFVFIPHSPP